MTTATNTQFHVAGLVEQTAPKGVKVAGEWYNINRNQQATGYQLPSYGEAVDITAHIAHFPDGKDVRFLDDYTVNMSSPAAQIDPDVELPAQHPAQNDRERTITRLACQRDAISLCAAMPAAFESFDALTAMVAVLREELFAWALAAE